MFSGAFPTVYTYYRASYGLCKRLIWKEAQRSASGLFKYTSSSPEGTKENHETPLRKSGSGSRIRPFGKWIRSITHSIATFDLVGYIYSWLHCSVNEAVDLHSLSKATILAEKFPAEATCILMLVWLPWISKLWNFHGSFYMYHYSGKLNWNYSFLSCKLVSKCCIKLISTMCYTCN